MLFMRPVLLTQAIAKPGLPCSCRGTTGSPRNWVGNAADVARAVAGAVAAAVAAVTASTTVVVVVTMAAALLMLPAVITAYVGCA